MKRKTRAALNTAHSADRKLSKVAAEARDTSPIRIAAAIGEIADQPPLIALSAATLIAGAVLRKPRVARAGARMLASHLLATAIKTVIKRSVDRTRPHASHDGDAYRLEKGGDHGHDLASFPSGHTAGIVAVARALNREVPESAIAAGAIAAAVAAIQLPNAKHYASDVAAGVVIGWASEALIDRAFGVADRYLGAPVETLTVRMSPQVELFDIDPLRGGSIA